MQKILFVATNDSVAWGGSESCWAGVAEKLVRRNVQICASVKDWGEPVKQIEHLKSVGCRIIYRRSLSLANRFIRKTFPTRNYESDYIKTHGAGMDLIVVSQGGNMDGYEWMEAARSNHFKYAVISQNAAEQWWPRDDFGEKVALAFESASAAYFVSEANLAMCRNQFATPLRHGRVIRNPYNVRYDAQPQWPQDTRLNLACVARLDVPQKGQDVLLQALSLPHWKSRDLHVSLVGTGPNERSLRRMAENLRLTNISFAGFVNDIENLWSKHHALVLTSRYEGLPLALVEAFLCSRPAIVTDVGGNRELLRDGVNGFLASAATVESVNEAMCRAWDNRQRLNDMGRTAGIDVRQLVSADPVSDFANELIALTTHQLKIET